VYGTYLGVILRLLPASEHTADVSNSTPQNTCRPFHPPVPLRMAPAISSPIKARPRQC
jgi:hypothetical protein